MTTAPEDFATRHIGPSEDQVSRMLEILGVDSLEHLIDETIPVGIRLKEPLQIPGQSTEAGFLAGFKALAAKNKIYKSFIGQGYYGTFTPPVILRNIFQNPGWYTAYTPYQAEIAQGRLEALVNFQTLVMDLTAMPLANASLLDEATSAAEAMHLILTARKPGKEKATKFFVAAHTFRQTQQVIRTRATPVGIEIITGSPEELDFSDPALFGILLQYPDDNGSLRDLRPVISAAHANNVLVAVATDLMALVLATPPGQMGADVVVGSSQRFGIPIGYGGPHAAFFATREEFKRLIPGRIIGVSVDVEGRTAYRMALQTREQHIRREKATSNICTAQVLLAVMAGMYAVYHGSGGLRKIALRIHQLAKALATGLEALGFSQENEYYFDTLQVHAERTAVEPIALKHMMNFHYSGEGRVCISLDETSTMEDVKGILEVFSASRGVKLSRVKASTPAPEWPLDLLRNTTFLTHPVFSSHHSELEMMRYLKRLENKDLSMVHSMIPLGSCTMKLNAASEMIPVSWPELSELHPFIPDAQARGYHEIIQDLENWLAAITGLPAVSLQPNAGAQGEFAGLMVIRGFHRDRGEPHRNLALIPSSAHGTNPASAAMAGMEVAVVRSDAEGKIDLTDLLDKAGQYNSRLACLMVTYPSTHGVFEEAITRVCDIIHSHGGLVYMDGANMNAQVGLTSPAQIGADVCHLNLHKTFCIPHGGGGPGMGPIAATEKLRRYLPGHYRLGTEGAVSAAPYGSANILAISYAYIALMGSAGLTRASQVAILSTNYLKHRLSDHYKILYTGKNNRCAHEMIVDCRDFKRSGIEVEDIAKRLIDYGFHAPTVSFPVPGTLMIEPTESENLKELDRFCEAMIAIRQEIADIEKGIAEKDNNVLTNAPHTVSCVASDSWSRPYSREKAAFPLPFVRGNKFWPSVARIDNAYGDRNLFCSCPWPLETEPEESARQNAQRTMLSGE